MVVVHIALTDAWVLNTWDKLMIPKPFSRGLDAREYASGAPKPNEAQKQKSLEELQAALDRVRDFAEAKRSKKPAAQSSP